MKKRFEKQKLYGVFWNTPRGLEGYTEHPFHMSWSKETVRVWRGVEGAKRQIDTIHKYKNFPVDAKGEPFLVRLNSKNSPVKLVEWHPFNAPKFKWRNAKFVTKELTSGNNFTD